MFLLAARLTQVLQCILFYLSARPSTLHASPAHSTRPSHTPLVPRTLYSSPTHSIHPPHTRTVLPTMNGKAEPSSVRLICSKGEILEVERSVAMKLKYVKNLMDKMDVTSGCAIPMGGIDKHTLNAIFRFIKYTTDMEKNQDPKRMESWKQFFENEDFSLLKLIEVRFSSSIFHLVSVTLKKGFCSDIMATPTCSYSLLVSDILQKAAIFVDLPELHDLGCERFVYRMFRTLR